MSTRVYQIAEELKVSNEEMIQKLKELDIDVETARAFFEKEYGQALELRLS